MIIPLYCNRSLPVLCWYCTCRSLLVQWWYCTKGHVRYTWLPVHKSWPHIAWRDLYLSRKKWKMELWSQPFSGILLTHAFYWPSESQLTDKSNCVTWVQVSSHSTHLVCCKAHICYHCTKTLVTACKRHVLKITHYVLKITHYVLKIIQ